MDRFDIAIIGTGPAGISAAITAKIRNKNILLIGTADVSEKTGSASLIKNYPGLPDVSGKELSESFASHLRKMEIPLIKDRIGAVYSMGNYFAMKGNHGDYEASCLILATGVSFDKALKGEKDFVGRGVSYCATCDGMFYRGKKIIVIAYDVACLDEIKYLSELCSEINLFCMFERNEFGPLPGNVVLKEGMPDEIKGKSTAESVLDAHGNVLAEAGGVFVFRKALSPENLVPGMKVLDGHVVVDRKMETSIKGCFACGDVTGKPYQYIKAAGEGNVAALSACSHLAEK